jgi:hypothetical protein
MPTATASPTPRFPLGGRKGGKPPAGGLGGGRTHVPGAERPTACLPGRLVEPPQGILGAQTSRGGAGCPDQPGHDAQAERSDPAAGMPGTPGGTAAGADPRRVTEAATMAAVAWTHRGRRRSRTRWSGGPSRMRFARSFH